MAELEHPDIVVRELERASEWLQAAHRAAGEREGDRTNLIGPVRDMLFGITSAVDALAQMVQEQAEGGGEPHADTTLNDGSSAPSDDGIGGLLNG